jgi:hypothetical protein
MREAARSAKELKVYQAAYALAMEIFRLSKDRPVEEKYSFYGKNPGSGGRACDWPDGVC